MIETKIVADSKNEFGNRITTMVVTFPRFILAELNTHRMFSRNSASSRAIPYKKMVQSVWDKPFIPIAFQKDHTGMQGTDYFEGEQEEILKSEWKISSVEAIKRSQVFFGFGVTKQLSNRLLEAFLYHTVIITSTEWENFFALRCPKYGVKHIHAPIDFPSTETTEYFRSKKDLLKSIDIFPEVKEAASQMTTVQWLKTNEGQAEIHMMALAEAMWDAYNESTPKELKAGEWHIPFSDDLPSIGSENEALKVATARCARVSYTVVGEEDKPANYENDIKLHDRLAASGHWSPFEHCAQSMTDLEYYENVRGIIPTFKEEKGDIFNAETYCTGEYANTTVKDSYGWSGNFRGFIQYRKMFANENVTK